MAADNGAVGDRGLHSGVSGTGSRARCPGKKRSHPKLSVVVSSVLVVIVVAAYGAGMLGSSSQSQNSHRLASVAPSPPPLCGHAMTYDSQSDRIILFGGATIGGYCAETWAYDFETNTWNNMLPAYAPPPRYYHGMTYDSHSDRVVLWGGAICSDETFWPMSDTWTYDFETNSWTVMQPSWVPPAKFAVGLAYDSESDLVVEYNGHQQFTVEDMTMTYDLDTNEWSDMNPGNSRTLSHAGFVYDSGSDRMVLFGMIVDYSPKAWTSATLSYDVDNNHWKDMNPRIQPPDGYPRVSGLAMAYDSQSDRTIMFGGNMEVSTCLFSDQTWAYDLDNNTWTRMLKWNSPSARAWHAMAYDSQSDRVILFGGDIYSACSAETWAYDFETNTWTPLPPGQIIPEFGATGVVVVIIATVCIFVVLRRTSFPSTKE